MYTKSYDSTINFLGEIAPTLDKATEFIRWAEEKADIIAFIYSTDYDQVTEDIVAAAKEEQGLEDEDDDIGEEVALR